MKKVNFVFVITGAFFISIQAQTYTITGKVFNAETKEPLPFVGIVLKGTYAGISSNYDGQFTIITNSPSDSIIASYMGYKRFARAIKKANHQVLNLPMFEEKLESQIVEVNAGENPAHRILRQVDRRKEFNDKNKLKGYEYEAYNKVEFDFTRISKEMRENKLFKPLNFIFNNIDSVYSDEKPSLPIFMIENISNLYYRKDPKHKKEVIIATKITGVENNSISQIMGDMYQNLNIYDKHIMLFNKQFSGPIADNGLIYYKYYLDDSVSIKDKKCYKIRFKPRRVQELSFTGTLWIEDSTWSIKRLEMSIPKDANINFINSAKFIQEFQNIDSMPMLVKDRTIIDFGLNSNKLGVYGRKTTSYKKIKLNAPKTPDFYEFGDKVVVHDSANYKNEKFWLTNRHDSLSQRELKIYKMIDTIKSLPVYRTFVDVITFLVSGYKTIGNFDYGPYFKLASYNDVEGLRLRCGMRTSLNFSKWYQLEGYAAYGTFDQEWKHGLFFKTFLSKKVNRSLMGVFYTDDKEIVGQSQGLFSQDNILASAFRVAPLKNLTRIKNFSIWIDKDLIDGLTTNITFCERIFSKPSIGSYEFVNQLGKIESLDEIYSTEARFNIRFAYKEKFIVGEFKRASLGTPYPIITFGYNKSIPKFINNNNYSYHKFILNYKQRIRLATMLGHSDVTVEAGKYYGNVPFPLLEIHPGNETLIFNPLSFNTMKYYEFASDQYVFFGIVHDFNGFFFNKIPLFRKLKLREVISWKGIIGTVSQNNLKELLFPSYLKTLSNTDPFMECTAGVKNILNIFRLDFLWHLSYRDPNEAKNFGFKFGVQLEF